jgi:hypothetical protein
MLTLPLSISSVAAAAQLVVQSEHQVSLLDPLTGVLKPLASFGEDWTNEAGSTGLGCNASHCISIGSWSMSPHCIGIFEKADPTNIHAVPLVGTTSGFSAPAFIESAREWQVLDLAGTLYRIDDALTLHKIAKASAFDPAQPYYYHAAPVPRDIGNDTMWCALSSASEPQGQVEGCFNASNMVAETSTLADPAGYNTNIATCGFCAAVGRLVCAGYNGTQYGVVGFDVHHGYNPNPSTVLGADPRTAGWKYGFSVGKFAVLGDGMFVMLAQPNLGVQRHAELFVTKFDPATRVLSAVSATVQPALDDGNLAWSAF